MPVTRDEVIWAYRLILGTEPETEEVVLSHATTSQNLKALRKNLLNSLEFKKSYFRLEEGITGAYNNKDVALVFLHIPKCAGTTFHEVLLKNFEVEDICPERFNGLSNWKVGELSAYRVFSGHFDLNSINLLPFKNKKIITIFRDPVKRLESLYYFLKAHNLEIALSENMHLVELAHDNDIEGFFNLEALKKHPSINNTFCRILLDDLPLKRWEEFNENLLENYVSMVDDSPIKALRLARNRLKDIRVLIVDENLNDNIINLAKDLKFDNISNIIVKRHQVLNEIAKDDPNMLEVEKQPFTNEVRLAISQHLELDEKLYTSVCDNCR